MPDAETARAATGYERGTITPFGAARRLAGRRRRATVAGRTVSIGAGAHGVAFTLVRQRRRPARCDAAGWPT